MSKSKKVNNEIILQQQPENKGEIVLYQPDSSLKLEVGLQKKRCGLTVSKCRNYLIET